MAFRYERAAAVDHGATALKLMTQCGDSSWCRMLRANATATWEMWDPLAGTHSHPWTASPASAIAGGLMGIRPTAPGWREWRAKPAPGNLGAASITVPTPHGPISLQLARRGGGLVARVRVPPSTLASVCLPAAAAVRGAGRSVVVDGERRRARLDPDGGHVCVDGLDGERVVSL